MIIPLSHFDFPPLPLCLFVEVPKHGLRSVFCSQKHVLEDECLHLRPLKEITKTTSHEFDGFASSYRLLFERCRRDGHVCAAAFCHA
jgi:hypothetical protein